MTGRAEITPQGRMALLVETAYLELVTRGGFPGEVRDLADAGVEFFDELAGSRWEATEAGRAAAARFRAGLPYDHASTPALRESAVVPAVVGDAVTLPGWSHCHVRGERCGAGAVMFGCLACRQPLANWCQVVLHAEAHPEQPHTVARLCKLCMIWEAL